MRRGRSLRLYRVFFFQAEDGIRDYKVTGVQTCALPILLNARALRHLKDELARLADQLVDSLLDLGEIDGVRDVAEAYALTVFPEVISLNRSEERRVGKECRSRWSPYH